QHQERVLIFQGLFMMDVGSVGVKDALASLREMTTTSASYDRIEKQLYAIEKRLPEIDVLIGRHTQNWSFNRLARVERNVLRLGAFELLVNIEPFQIVISEAVDLAKEFADDKSGGFVNGVLDAVWRTVSPTGETVAE
ncbi:unnamed protein product, partial [Phaeothamnion confervicola]